MTEDQSGRALAAADALGLAHEVKRHGPVRSLAEAAAARGVEPHQVVKTMVVRVTEGTHVFVLVPGGRRFDWPRLRAHLGTNRLSLPDADEAREITGYERGAITPFGAKRAWPVIVDASIEGRAVVAVGGGARGVNVHIAPADLVRATGAEVIEISVPEPSGG